MCFSESQTPEQCLNFSSFVLPAALTDFRLGVVVGSAVMTLFLGLSYLVNLVHDGYT